jgi:hypothetical protein
MAGEWLKLIDEGTLGQVTRRFHEAIEKSLEPGAHPMRHLTQAEVKHRFNLCADIFSKLRGDLKWGLQRILDNLPRYLNDKIAGKFMPDARTVWAPGDD